MKAVYFIKEYGKFKEGDQAKLDANVVSALMREGVVSFTYPVVIDDEPAPKPKRAKKT